MDRSSLIPALNNVATRLRIDSLTSTSAAGSDVDVSSVFGKPGDHPPVEPQLPPGVHYPPGCIYETGDVSCRYHDSEARN